MTFIEVKEVSLVKRIGLRFIKAFVLGGLASALIVQPLQGFDPLELQTWGLALVNAFIFGGFMALEKLLRAAK